MKRPKGAIGFDRILKEAEQIGLNVIAYAIIGMPGQTIEEMVDTLIYLMGKRVLFGPSVYYPIPGTLLFERCKKENIIPPHLSQWRSSAIPIGTGGFSRIDIVTLLDLARVINFVKGKMDKGEIDEGVTWKELYRVLDDRKGREVWVDLLLLILNEKSFFTLRKDSGGEASVLREKRSQRVLDYFFEKAWGEPIFKSRNS
jgi:hypothetical protein